MHKALQIMKFTGEFFIPPEHNEGEFHNHELQIEHKHRYLSVLNLVKGKIVLDIACGEGYGSNMLSRTASQVYAVDVNPELIEHASEIYANKNISFLKGSVNQVPLPGQSVDVIVSFETIEHVTAEVQKQFVAEAKRVLKPGGLMIVSTPDKKNYTERYKHFNKFHLHELYSEEFVDLLKTQFKHVNLYGQGFEVTSLIFNKNAYQMNMPLSSYKINENAFKFEPKYLIALCSDDYDLTHASISGIIPEHEKSFFQMSDRIINLQNEVKELGEACKKNEDINLILADKTTEINSLKKELEKKSNEIYKLKYEKKQLNNRLEDIYSSDGWKLLSVYYNFKGKYLSENSKAYKRLKAIKNLVQLKKPGKLPVINIETARTLIPQIPGDIQFPLAFPVFNQPLVSIIIPAYNNWEFTKNCLVSIYLFTNNVSYEIIVGDNVSTDETINLENYFKNINYLRNKENLGYIRNINNAATHARGQFILTLNNDTTVTPNWLSSMIEVMDNDKSVGLVGSKLVFPNGKLQEAGGIIWQDASGWNFGRDQDPDAPEYNYLKEADYISGASNLIRKDIWDRLKGLDERYVPAYFDDSDLAFNIRSLGYKVMYQPLSVVIHYEGLTHGTSTSSGTKKYQAINLEKFIDKWTVTLNEEQFVRGENVFLARDRSRNKKTIVVIDHYVPHFDKDAGSRTTFQYLELFVELGLNVKFIGDNFIPYEPYTTILQQKGIEVLYGMHYALNWQQWITDNQQYIDFILLNRPHISKKHIDLLKQKTKAQILYYGHDLHFVREQKEYEVTKNPKKLKSSLEWKKTEYKLFQKSDIILTPTAKEKEIIGKDFSDKKIEVMPAFFYPNIAEPITNFAERKNLLFVGGFGHSPNIDAVLWFAEKVLPLLKQQVPDIKLFVVGSNVPDNIARLASANIVIRGFVSDEELNELYQNVQIAVMPLRYGAGLKGKTVEAMVKGLPIVSTSFGLEGMPGVHDLLHNNDSEKEFADAILAIYNKPEKLQQLSSRIVEYAVKHFTKEQAKVFFKSLFNL